MSWRKESVMKKGIHPEYKDTEVECACGNKFTVRSNHEKVHLEVCNKCHPFYVGDGTITNRKAGNVEKFNRKYGLEKEAK
jgi:large subunit ribosomal protein L31